ncbi:hypothetical protein GF366_01865 [Candidatus Peregrinibacteria bacterium]|nr:hypothetical protein [Candidatus Peregrinibacteria bacterium]
MGKKLFLSFISLSLIFFGCTNGGNKISSLNYFTDNGAVSPPYYYESSLIFVPDYELRTLEVSYSVVYPFRTEETESIDVDTEGIIGGNYFDRFEKIVNLFESGKFDDLKEEDIVGAGGFDVILEKEGSSVEKYSFRGVTENKNFKTVKSFHDDVVALFSEDL